MAPLDGKGRLMGRGEPGPAGRVHVADVVDGAVLLDEKTGTFYHLNPTGALAYRLLLRVEGSVADVARVLACSFDVDESTVRRDVEVFVDELARRRLVDR
jgi:hypothetical protein